MHSKISFAFMPKLKSRFLLPVYKSLRLRKTGCLRIILSITIIKRDGKINVLFLVLFLYYVQEEGKVGSHQEFFRQNSQKGKESKIILLAFFFSKVLHLLKKLLVILCKYPRNVIYLEFLYCGISDELGCHGIRCFIDFESCWLFSLPFLSHEIREHKKQQPFKSETKIIKLLQF